MLYRLFWMVLALNALATTYVAWNRFPREHRRIDQVIRFLGPVVVCTSFYLVVWSPPFHQFDTPGWTVLLIGCLVFYSVLAVSTVLRERQHH